MSMRETERPGGGEESIGSDTAAGWFRSISGAIKEFIGAVRDGLLILLAVALLVSPETVKAQFGKAGVQEADFGFLKWKADEIRASAEQTKAAGQVASDANTHYDELIVRLAELEKRVSQPDVKADLNSIGNDARASQKQIAGADRLLKQSLATQQQIIAQISPPATAAEAEAGWLYLGKVSETKTEWLQHRIDTLPAAAPNPASGTKLRLGDNAYFHADAPGNAHKDAPILSLVAAGTLVEVLETDFSHAVGGGWFLWLKARRVAQSG